MTILRLDRPGDLDAPVAQVGGRRRDAPVAVADVLRLGRNAGSSPAARRARRSTRLPSSARRSGSNVRCSSATNASASGVRTREECGVTLPRTTILVSSGGRLAPYGPV